VKPNNYPNFEFHESPKQDTAEVKQDQSFGSFEFAETTPGVEEREYKPNNYNDFKLTEEEAQGGSREDNQIAKGQFSSFGEHQSFSAQDGVVYDARHQYKVGDAQYRASNRYPSSYESLASNEVRFTNTKHVEVEDKSVGQFQGQGGSSQFYTPSSNPDFAFRFANPESHNQFRVDNQADKSVYSQFNFDNSDATNDPTATYGTTTPVLADRSPASASGHGCANMYWAEHTKQWPSFFSVDTQVTQAFGTKTGAIYGTTTLLQALYDNRDDGYSQLLSHGTAALMNSYAMPNYGLRHDAVIDQFLGALSSRTSAAVQAQKFLNANHAYGPNECAN
jgi:hypothetical protein